jgi:CO/xanthine dehydrogenase FAD-binding subunit
MVTLETLEKSPFVLNKYAPLAQAFQLAAILSIRHGATIGEVFCLGTRCIYYKKY